MSHSPGGQSDVSHWFTINGFAELGTTFEVTRTCSTSASRKTTCVYSRTSHLNDNIHRQSQG